MKKFIVKTSKAETRTKKSRNKLLSFRFMFELIFYPIWVLSRGSNFTTGWSCIRSGGLNYADVDAWQGSILKRDGSSFHKKRYNESLWNDNFGLTNNEEKTFFLSLEFAWTATVMSTNMLVYRFLVINSASHVLNNWKRARCVARASHLKTLFSCFKNKRTSLK